MSLNVLLALDPAIQNVVRGSVRPPVSITSAALSVAVAVREEIDTFRASTVCDSGVLAGLAALHEAGSHSSSTPLGVASGCSGVNRSGHPRVADEGQSRMQDDWTGVPRGRELRRRILDDRAGLTQMRCEATRHPALQLVAGLLSDLQSTIALALRRHVRSTDLR
jgi:hypothetical protein